jgi:uncharacterized membrane protein YcaP (DUF421 family)
MDSVLRGAAIYLFLLVVFRVTGQRSLSQVTTFDFVLLLIISETTQQALLGEDFSVTGACLLIVTLFTLDQGLAWLKDRSAVVERVTEGLPLVVVEDGKPIREHLDHSLIDEDDVLQAARQLQGLERMEQIKYAVLERNGGITVIPKGKE